LPDWDRDRPSCIKRILLAEKVSSEHPLAKFVGKIAYKKAGRSIVSSLFDDTEVYENHDLLQQLALKRLQDEAKRLTGWGWVEITIDSPYNDLYHSTAPLIPVGKLLPEDHQNEIMELEKEAEELDELD